MPSLVNTWPGWYRTVRELMNRRAPISGFDRPSRASRATWASWAVSGWLAGPGGVRAGWAVRLRLSRRWSAARGGRARRTPPSPLRPASGMRCATGRAPWRYGARGAATRRKAGENGPARNEAGSGQGGTHNRRQRLNAAEPAGCPRQLAGSTVWLPVRLPMLLTEPIGIPTIWARYRLPRRKHELRQ